MANGSVPIWRDITHHWIFEDPEQFRAWVHLIILAAWRDHSETCRGKTTYRKRGTVHCSLRWLADKWGWTIPKVSRFLDKLQADNMVNVEKNGSGTTITIINYDKWQPQPNVTPNVTQNVTQNVTGSALEIQGVPQSGVTLNVTPNVTQNVNTIIKDKRKKESVRKQVEESTAAILDGIKKRRDTVNERTESK